MVFFTCNGCGSSLKKAAVEKHYQFECRNCEVLSCMDCGKDFYGDDYKLHTTCVTEDEKYGGKDYKATPNKGDVKQAQWMERVKKASENPAVDHKVKQILSRLHGGLMNNVPRKKPKFKNFLANSFRIHDDRLAEKVWDILNTSVDDEKTTNGQTANKPHKDTKTSNASAKLADQSQASKQKHQGDPEFMTEGDEEVSAAVVKKKKKKKKKSNEENTEHILAKSGDQVESHISESNSKQVLMDKEEFIVNGHNENNSSDSKTRRKKKKNLHKEVTKMNGKTGDDNFGVDWAEQKVKKRKRSQENDFDDKTEAKAAKVFKQEQEQQLPPTGGKFPWEQVITQVLRKGSDKEISVKKLRKKVLSEYHNFGGDPRIKTEEKLEATFHKKLTKNPKFVVRNEVVKFSR